MLFMRLCEFYLRLYCEFDKHKSYETFLIVYLNRYTVWILFGHLTITPIIV